MCGPNLLAQTPVQLILLSHRLAHQVMLNHVIQLGIYEVAVERPQQVMNGP